jgi:hypothetical protein
MTATVIADTGPRIVTTTRSVDNAAAAFGRPYRLSSRRCTGWNTTTSTRAHSRTLRNGRSICQQRYRPTRSATTSAAQPGETGDCMAPVYV